IPADLKGVDPDERARDTLAHVRVHPLDDGHDRHEEADRHDDPEQREERAELVAPRGLERLENGFGEGHGGETNGGRPVMRPAKGLDTTLTRPLPGASSGYSYLSASTGSNLAALLAGYRPKPIPVRADAPR